MTPPKDIEGRANSFARTVSSSLSLSTSPTLAFHSPPSSFRNPPHPSSTDGRPGSLSGISPVVAAKQLKPFHTKDVKVLLLENVNQTGVEILKGQGYQVEALKSSLPEDQLIQKIREVHVIGIRSKTKLTERVLKEAKNLIVIGCFCIGTNQVDLRCAALQGIAVFNSPFSNSRSVAELVIAEIIALARQLTDRSMELHNGTWNKVSKGCWEIRGKTLGIVGYGHIGSQLSVLAESMGMSVIYYDILNLMALGTARQVASLDDLLDQADFVSLHVPETPDTKDMISKEQLAKMKDASYLLNNARGSVVDIPALVEAMREGKIAGAALDVYPNEPAGNGDYFTNDLNSWTKDLRSLKNLILTPHIGGSTEEAQSAIGIEVSTSLVRYVNEGSTLGAVNMPEVSLRSLTLEEPNCVRVIYIHKNVPGVLRQVNAILAHHNVEKQMTDSRAEVAYLMADISEVKEEEIKDLWQSLEELSCMYPDKLLRTNCVRLVGLTAATARIRTRVLY
ncbi:D-3-phosphoglycerate dehydrogenase-like protein [Lindgomyces ingoldianus]|uniref:D-3-phosphoglycerate dehydrogenase-like protein n=1 Tax=Lindgomyces ingoldianus TaxID=673940 RepID=A0ACB6R513_9PLEO|nr:D-3-phosphoglycerate dehydrogenase-like protein [Lindgomyces ingoldianus]KAF2474378.1 D-3-phosphoglycerate dehydrogenase-like protein [Lindgomyces ingoldianus]